MNGEQLVDEHQGDTAEAGSSYPPKVDDLIPQARVLAESMGEVPSRNRLMAELKIGAPKATALRDILLAEARPEPTETVEPAAEPEPTPGPAANRQVRGVGHPGTDSARTVRAWPLLILAAPAFVAIWSGWVGLGGLTGFGDVHPLPGIWDEARINSAITLPIGLETYAAFALHAWLSSSRASARARRFAKWSAIGSLGLGAAGQVAYHLMVAAGMTSAPWPITTAVAVLPVAVLGMGTALAQLLRAPRIGGEVMPVPDSDEDVDWT